ncbi:hypothetical protein [uncultured Ilyobacter sp.]|uniref:hypothetical protein n=1 Tax=uncultured Ilyobacter sp. TaxID=544433 RepID=UPI0029C7904C|nr:hypothetical protein [uncultured Ilyobacter sp.]
MSLYIFEYTLPKGYYLKVINHYEDMPLMRAFLYRGRSSFQRLVNVMDFEVNTSKLKIVEKSISFIELLEERINSGIEVR